MRERDIQENKLYTDGNRFRYIVPWKLRMGCDFYQLGGEVWYLSVGDSDSEKLNSFPCKFQTFQTWAKREATPEEYALYQSAIDKTLKKLELQVEINKEEEVRLNKYLNRIIKESVTKNLSTEELEVELKKRKS